MQATGSHDDNRAYYDAFSARYEERRGDNDPGGYHELLDRLEADYVERFATGKTVLEVGCGTGLVLQRIASFARRARGVDLSSGMLAVAKDRGLDVREASATDLPFEDAAFDVTCAFKVLAHVRDIERALAEMARVTRPGGMVLAEFYNPMSWRGLARRFGPAGTVAHGTTERHVFTRFDSPIEARRLTPPGCRLRASRGIRIVTPAAQLLQLPGVGPFLSRAEWALADSPLRVFGGFYVAAYEKLV